MSEISKKIAKLLISLECVQLCPERPFTYASGLKGPIYTDNRKLLSNVDARNEVCQAFVKLIKNEKMTYDSIAGMATAGIAHAALVSNELLAPMVYVRSKPKGHGRQNQVEGSFKVGEKLILIEDLVNNIINDVINKTEVIDYSKMKVKELKAECKKRGLKKYSKLKKQQLIDLLKQ